MSKTKVLYFLKVNINSHILDIYDEHKKFDIIKKYILNNFKDGNSFSKETVEGKGEEKVSKNVTYTLHRIINIDDSIVGLVVRDSKVYVNKFEEESGKIHKRAVPNDEVIEFYYDLNSEIVVFYTSNRFGYKDFEQAFKGILNNLEIQDHHERVIFDVSLLRKGLSIQTLKSEIKKLGPLKTLKFEVIPPNANGDILKSIKEKGKERVKSMKSANVTKIQTEFESLAKSGINIDSEIINEELNRINELHEEISPEQSQAKGYVKVDAEGKDGGTFSTRENTVVKYTVEETEIEGMYEFKETASKFLQKIAQLFL